MMDQKSDLVRKLTSRKFWICIAAFLASLGTGIAGIANGSERVAMAGGTCCVVSTAIYAACEAHVDGKYAEATQTLNTTNVTATSASQKAVEAALMPKEGK